MANDHDMKAAEGTYSGFLSFLKWGTIVSALTTALVVMLLAG